MIIGIVGAEAAKFTAETEAKAREAIRENLKGATKMCSGHCHLGGIDIWAEEEADKLGIEKLIFPPKELGWYAGYKPRNLLIASNSDLVLCITVRAFPPDFKGMRFPVCYHCQGNPNGCQEPHIKSGGCWTALRCKQRKWVVV